MQYKVQLTVIFYGSYNGKSNDGSKAKIAIFEKQAEIWFPLGTKLPKPYLVWLGLAEAKVISHSFDDKETIITHFIKKTDKEFNLEDYHLKRMVSEMNKYGWNLYYSDFKVINEI